MWQLKWPLGLYNAVYKRIVNYLMQLKVFFSVYERHSVVDIVHFFGSLNSCFIIVIASDLINVTLVTDEECADGEYNQLWEKLSKMVTNLFVQRTCTTKRHITLGK